MIEFAGLALQPIAEAAPRPGIGGVDPPTFPSLRKPELFIMIVAAAETDLARLVIRQNSLGHLHREESHKRQIVKPFVVSKFVNNGPSEPQDPKLRSGLHAVDVV